MLGRLELPQADEVKRVVDVVDDRAPGGPQCQRERDTGDSLHEHEVSGGSGPGDPGELMHLRCGPPERDDVERVARLLQSWEVLQDP